MSLYSFLAGLFELGEAGKSIVTHNIVIYHDQITVFLVPKLTLSLVAFMRNSDNYKEKLYSFSPKFVSCLDEIQYQVTRRLHL